MRFDLGGAHTYDTRPMPDDGSKLNNVAVLADETAQVELVVPVETLDRLLPLLASPTGMVNGSIGFSRERSWVIAEIEFSAGVELYCQRCLGKMPMTLSGHSRVALVESQSAVDDVPQEWETSLAPDGRVRLCELLEEEVLLALPPAPRHAEGQCRDATVASPTQVAAPTQRPFAGLEGLLKSGRPQK